MTVKTCYIWKPITFCLQINTLYIVYICKFLCLSCKHHRISWITTIPVFLIFLSDAPRLSPINNTKSGEWKGPNINSDLHGGEECLYDLYAVCNHFGSLNSGHYTACCSNPLNGKWYKVWYKTLELPTTLSIFVVRYQFDDSNTEVIQEQDLSSQSAYILFYQRRSVSAALSCGGMSNNSIMSDHWACNLPQYKQKVQVQC